MTLEIGALCPGVETIWGGAVSGSRTPTTLPQVPPEVPPRAVRSNLPDRERAQPLIDAGRLTLIFIKT